MMFMSPISLFLISHFLLYLHRGIFYGRGFAEEGSFILGVVLISSLRMYITQGTENASVIFHEAQDGICVHLLLLCQTIK